MPKLSSNQLAPNDIVYFVSDSGTLHKFIVLNYNDRVEVNVKNTVTLDQARFKVYDLSSSPDEAYSFREKAILASISQWGGAIARAEVILNRMDRQQMFKRIVTEEGFTKMPEDAQG